MSKPEDGEDFVWYESPDDLCLKAQDVPTIPIAADLMRFKDPRLSRIRKWGAGILMVAAASSLLANHSRLLQRDNKTSANSYPGVANGSQNGCPAVNQQEVSKIAGILRQPDSPAIDTILREYGIDSLTTYQKISRIAHGSARANNLNLVDEKSYEDKMLETPGLSEQLRLINSFTNHYGFKVTIYHGRGAKNNVVPFAPSELDNYVFDEGFINLMNTLRYIPIEEIRATGLRELRIVKGINDPDGERSDIDAQAVDGNLIEASLGSLLATDSSDTIFHELGHLIDYNYCGDFGFSHYDPSYEDLNPASLEYGTGGYWQNATVSQYGSSNLMEDKAEMYEQMLGGLNQQDIHDRYRVIRKKYALLLARLDEKAPGIAQYLADISHQTSDS